MNATHAYTLRGPSTKECPKTTPGTRYPHRSVLDTALPVLNSVARHRYSEQFKRDAVALYENNEDLSLHAASAELGVNRSSLFSWLQQYGTGKRARTKAMRDNAKETTDSERIRQLEKENAKLREERDILRKAAKYFAEETRW